MAIAKLNANLLKITPFPPNPVAEDIDEIWYEEKKLTNKSNPHCEVFQENNGFNKNKFKKIKKRKKENGK